MVEVEVGTGVMVERVLPVKLPLIKDIMVVRRQATGEAEAVGHRN